MLIAGPPHTVQCHWRPSGNFKLRHGSSGMHASQMLNPECEVLGEGWKSSSDIGPQSHLIQWRPNCRTRARNAGARMARSATKILDMILASFSGRSVLIAAAR